MSRLAISPSFRPPRRKTVPVILGIGAASPPSLTQEQILQVAIELARPTASQEAWLSRVFRNSGIEERGVILTGMDGLRSFYPPPASDSDRGPTTAQRMQRYAIEAPALATEAATRSLQTAQLEAGDITHLITASCTGFAAPGLDAALMNELGLSPSVRRLHVGFMGCHAAFNALGAACDTVRADRRAKVLVCCVELCSLHMAYGWDPGKLVANALFADGAAAMIVGDSPEDDAPLWRLRDTSSFLLPDSLDAMTWRIGDHGFEMTLLPGVPTLVRQHLGTWCRSWLARHGLGVRDISGWAIHPGGPKILAAVADALNLAEDSLRHSRQVLAHHGNMSSATVPFILDHMARQNQAGPCVAIGLGPGLMAEGMLLDRCGS
jgi:predicted naringenin-chalcone synthase